MASYVPKLENVKLEPHKQRKVSFITNGFLRETKDTFATTIIGVLYLSSNPGIDNLRKVIGDRLLKFTRFRSKAVWSGNPQKLTWNFEELPLAEVDLNWHVTTLFSDEVVSRADIDAWAGSRYMAEVDWNRPLWRFYLVPKVDDGRVALVSESNHALTDGVALVEVLLSLVDEINPNTRAPPKRTRKPPIKSPLRRMRVFFVGLSQAIATVGGFPMRDVPNQLKLEDVGNPSRNRACGSSEKLNLSKVKEIKDAVEDCTLNVVLLTMLNLIVIAYFKEKHGQPPKGLIRGIFPINLRKNGTRALLEKELGNNFSLGGFKFLTNYKDRVDLLKKVKQELDDLNYSPLAKIGHDLAAIAMPTFKDKDAILRNRVFISTATAMLSNVAGPQTQVALAGAPIDELCFYTLTAQGVYLGVLTYNNQVTATLVLDENCEKDPNMLTKHWKPEFEKLYEEVMNYKAKNGKIKARQPWF